jgi:nitrous oxidase accessory protein NosD
MIRLILAVVLLSVGIGCGDDDSSSSDTITVRPGESIQAAVDAAPPGGRVEVMPGEYVETHGGQAAVLVEKSLQLIGLNQGGEVKILPGPGNTEGIYVRGAADAFIEDILIEGFTVDGFSENGIWTLYVRNFEIRSNNVGNSDHVGIYPQLSAQGLVQDNVAFGGLDSALWVSGSEDIRVIDNEAYGAPIGLQVNVSKAVEVEAMTAYNNVVGIALTHPLASGLGDDVDLAFGYRSESVRFANSEVFDNNLPNPVSGGLVGQLPTGTGLLITGHDRSYVEDNSLIGNDYAGLVLVDHCIVTGETDDDCAPDGNIIVRNTITDNGTNPPDSPFKDLASDVIVIVGTGTGNCMADNMYDTDVGAAAIQAESCPPFTGF